MRNNNPIGNWGSSNKILFAISVLILVFNDGSVSCSSDLYNSTPSPQVYNSPTPPYHHSSSQPSTSPPVQPPPPYLYSSPPSPSPPPPNLYKSSPTSPSTRPPPYINNSYASPLSSPSTPPYLHKSAPSSPSTPPYQYNSSAPSPVKSSPQQYEGSVSVDPNLYTSPSLIVQAIGKVYCYRCYDWGNPKMSHGRIYLKGATVELRCSGGEKDIVAYGTSKINGKYSVAIQGLDYAQYGVNCKAVLHMSPTGSDCSIPTDLLGEEQGVHFKLNSKNHQLLVVQSKSFAYASVSPNKDCYLANPNFYPADLNNLYVEHETGIPVNWTTTSFDIRCYLYPPSTKSKCTIHQETVYHNVSDAVIVSDEPSNSKASQPESSFLVIIFIYAIFIVM